MDKDFINLTNHENGLTKMNKAIYGKFQACTVPAMIAAKPAYNLAQMYMQSLDFMAKANDLITLTETTDLAEKILELREAVKSVRHYSEQFGRNYYVLMDKVTALTESWLGEGAEDFAPADAVEDVLSGLRSNELIEGMRDEIEAHARKQYGALVKKLIAKGCPEDVANFFSENMFELRMETDNLIAMVDRLVTLDSDFENLVFDVEEVLVEISIPWVGFSPGETAHALWHIGDHDDDNFFFMGFLGWSLAVLENLQENTENL